MFKAFPALVVLTNNLECQLDVQEIVASSYII